MDCRSIILLSLIVPSLAMAAWSDRPTWSYQRSGRTHAAQSYSGLVERCYALDISLPSSPSWYRSQRSMLKTYKTSAAAIITSFVDRSEYDESFNGWFAQTTNLWSDASVAYFPMLTVTGVCDYLDIPTNFFSYTPWRCLNQLGPYTNDDDYATIGHAHGWTNETTAAGGPYFPSSRDTWFTTDYGWENLMRVIDLLVWTQVSPQDGPHHLSDTSWCSLKLDWAADHYTTNCCGVLGVMTISVDPTNYPSGRSHFISFYADTGNKCSVATNASGYQSHAEVIRYGSSFGMVSTRSRDGFWALESIDNHVAHAAELYAAFRSYGFEADYHDYAGVAPSYDQYYRLQTFPALTTEQRTSSTIVAAPAAAYPVTIPSTSTRWSQSAYKDAWLIKWNVSGGFKYIQ